MLIKIVKMVLLLTTTLVLCQCTTPMNSSLIESSIEPIPLKKRSHPVSASSYLSQAKSLEGSAKQNTLLKAAKRTIAEGRWRQGEAILAQTADLSPELADQKAILLAQIDLIRDRPTGALSKLHGINEHNTLPRSFQILLHELLAQADAVTSKPIESITERIKLESLLTEERLQKINRRTLWFTLTHLSRSELHAVATATTNQVELEGWLQLALISRTHRDKGTSLLVAIKQWQTHFPNHPASTLLPDPLDSVVDKMMVQPKQIALLLPLSGGLQGPGMAVRDGFMAAFKEHQEDASIDVKVYDTNKEDIASIYQSAVAEGADYVVGPLSKPQVGVIAELPHPVPTLLLNDTDVMVQDNSYLFGLSPQNEAVQVAIKARSKGYNRALIIAPDNEWGNEVNKAFIQQWQKQNGRIVDTLLYTAHDDLNKKMRDFLHITNSQQREKQIKEVLGYQIQSIISRRQDFDVIFLLAYPSKARQIMPLLNYYYASDVPVFSTASVYGGSANALKDKDLDGIIFCDIPWVFSHQMGTRNWPEQFNSYNRLYALGRDSYILATQLNQLIVFPADESTAGDGILYLKSSQQIAHVLEWGQFKQGLAHSLGEAA